MARRAPYTKVEKEGQRRPAHVKGKGDVVYRRFQCLHPECVATIVAADADCTAADFRIKCPACGYLHFAGGAEHLFEYELRNKASGAVLNEGPFDAAHDAYVGAAERVKYCLNCYTLQPLANFDRHASRQSQRQGECKLCKQLYNEFKNGSRLTEQHREAAETRRLLTALAGEADIGSVEELLDAFEHRCFNCERELEDSPGGEDGYHLDHTLPVSWLWPLDHGPTVLCRKCNGAKRDRWPADFYEGDGKRLRALAVRTGISYEVLAGDPTYNPAALQRLREDPDGVIERAIDHPERLQALRTKILGLTGEDVFAGASAKPLRALESS